MVNVGQYDVDRWFETTVLVKARTSVFVFYVVCIKQIKQKGYFLYFYRDIVQEIGLTIVNNIGKQDYLLSVFYSFLNSWPDRFAKLLAKKDSKGVYVKHQHCTKTDYLVEKPINMVSQSLNNSFSNIMVKAIA